MRVPSGLDSKALSRFPLSAAPLRYECRMYLYDGCSGYGVFHHHPAFYDYLSSASYWKMIKE